MFYYREKGSEERDRLEREKKKKTLKRPPLPRLPPPMGRHSEILDRKPTGDDDSCIISLATVQENHCDLKIQPRS